MGTTEVLCAFRAPLTRAVAERQALWYALLVEHVASMEDIHAIRRAHLGESIEWTVGRARIG